MTGSRIYPNFGFSAYLYIFIWMAQDTLIYVRIPYIHLAPCQITRLPIFAMLRIQEQHKWCLVNFWCETFILKDKSVQFSMQTEVTIESGGYKWVLHCSLMLAQIAKERSELTEIQDMRNHPHPQNNKPHPQIIKFT